MSLHTPAASMVIVSVDVEGKTDVPVAALDILVDGREDSQVLVFPERGRTHDVLAGPFSAGRHTIAVRPSPLWRWPSGIDVAGVRAEAVGPERPEYTRLRWAPRLGLRADTIGASNDLPLLMYVETLDDQLRYSAVFSNEDGGTAARPLMARWGRTTDIEWVAAIRPADPTRWTFQGPEHQTRSAPATAEAPMVVVATLNNVFLASGASRASVRPVPRVVDLAAATRESVMDDEPWIYRRMSRELEAEGKLDGGGGHDMQRVADPRRHVYVEARLTLKEAAVAAWIETSDGRWASSHLGSRALAIARDGWIRTAVEIGTALPSRLAWECVPAGDVPAAESACEIETTRLFALDEEYRPLPNRIRRTALRLGTGDMAVVGNSAAPLE